MRIELSTPQLKSVKKWLKLVIKISPTSIKLSVAQNVLLKNGFGYRDYKEAERLSRKSDGTKKLSSEQRLQLNQCLVNEFQLSSSDSIGLISKLDFAKPESKPLFIDEAGLFYSSMINNAPLSDEVLQNYRSLGLAPRLWETIKRNEEYFVVTLDAYNKAFLDIDFDETTKEEAFKAVCSFAIPLYTAIATTSVFNENPLGISIEKNKVVHKASHIVLTPYSKTLIDAQSLVSSLLTLSEVKLSAPGPFSVPHLGSFLGVSVYDGLKALVSTELYFKLCAEHPLIVKGNAIEQVNNEKRRYPDPETLNQWEQLEQLKHAINASQFDEQMSSKIVNAPSSSWEIIWDYLRQLPSLTTEPAEAEYVDAPLLYAHFDESTVLKWAGAFFDDFELEYRVDDHKLIEYLLREDYQMDGSFDEYQNCPTLAAALSYQSIIKARDFSKLLDRLLFKLGVEYNRISSLIGSYEWFEQAISDEKKAFFGHEYRSFQDNFRLARKHNSTLITVTQTL